MRRGNGERWIRRNALGEINIITGQITEPSEVNAVMPNHQLLQILQLALFSITALSLLAMGLMILFKPVSALNQRWMLAVFLPLLLANPLAILANESLSLAAILGDWQFWLILATDLGLAMGLTLSLRGYAVYGLTEDTVKTALGQSLAESGKTVQVSQGERKSFWGGNLDATVLTWESDGEMLECYLITRAGEVGVRAASRRSLRAIKSHVNAVRKVAAAYDFRQHAMGVLYLVLALVFTVLSWIFFFEPRLVLIQ